MAELLEELLARCHRGEVDAIETLVRRYRNDAMHLATRITHDRHLAEDAVQEALMSALARLDDLRRPAAFAGWLRQIVRTHATRAVRGRRPGTPATVATSAGDAPDDDLAQAERRRLVSAALDSMTDAPRDAAVLYYLHGLDHHQVAAALDIPPGTVKRRLHDARTTLRRALTDPQEPDPRRGDRGLPAPL